MQLITENPFECGYDEVLAKEIAETLHKHYAGWMWIVSMQDHNPIIRLGEAIQAGWCYMINRKDLPQGSPERLRKMILIAGGEMLERLNINRKAKEDGFSVETLFEGSEVKPLITSMGAKHLKKSAGGILLP